LGRGAHADGNDQHRSRDDGTKRYPHPTNCAGRCIISSPARSRRQANFLRERNVTGDATMKRMKHDDDIVKEWVASMLR
jgi:hypothetical protein